MNVGIDAALRAGATTLLFLNQDTVLAPDALDRLLDAASRHPSFASFQPLLLRPGGTVIDSAGQRVHRVPGATDHLAEAPAAAAPAGETEIFGACAAACLVRAEALRKAGPFDDAFFLVFEDTDLAFRLRYAAGGALLVPSARVEHVRGVSGKGAARSPLRRFLVARNGVGLALRHWPLRWLVLASPLLLLRALTAIRFAGHAPSAAEAGDRSSPVAFWRRSLGLRAAQRRAAAAAGTDRWFGRPSAEP
jgi:GT2 family glycosyltransferase